MKVMKRSHYKFELEIAITLFFLNVTNITGWIDLKDQRTEIIQW